jgi:hypothetical protein
MSIKRNAYLLTCDFKSERAQFCKNVLENIGFHVNMVLCFPHKDSLTSNKLSMQYILKLMSVSDDAWSYFFEDDINVLQDIKLDEIIQYEKISDKFFYLGVCINPIYLDVKNRHIIDNISLTENEVNNYPVYKVSNYVRATHAVAFSKEFSAFFLNFIQILNFEEYDYTDVILEYMTTAFPANIVRYDLESDIQGHRGVIYQDREKFQSLINPEQIKS